MVTQNMLRTHKGNLLYSIRILNRISPQKKSKCSFFIYFFYLNSILIHLDIFFGLFVRLRYTKNCMCNNNKCVSVHFLKQICFFPRTFQYLDLTASVQGHAKLFEKNIGYPTTKNNYSLFSFKEKLL